MARGGKRAGAGRPINLDKQYAKLDKILERAEQNVPKLIREKGFYENDYILKDSMTSYGFYADLEDALDQLRDTKKSADDYAVVLKNFRDKMRAADLMTSPVRAKRLEGLGLAAEEAYLRDLEEVPTFTAIEAKNKAALIEKFKSLTPAQKGKFITSRNYQDPKTLRISSPTGKAQKGLSKKAFGKTGFMKDRFLTWEE